MLLSFAFPAMLALASAQPDADEQTARLMRTAPLELAHQFCSGEPNENWREADEDDSYVTSVREYWAAAGTRTGVTYTQHFFAGQRADGSPDGSYMQHVFAGDEKTGQHSCILHFPGNAPSATGPEDLETFAGSPAREKLIPLLDNETTWEVTLTPEFGYDFASISEFGPISQDRRTTATHPFRGIQYRFLKLGAF